MSQQLDPSSFAAPIDLHSLVEALLQEAGATHTITHTGQASPWGTPCDAWAVTLTRNGHRETFAYYTGLGLRKQQKPQAPHVADVLHSLLMDSVGTGQPFADWCADLGYDTDSRKALSTYLECQDSGVKLRKVIPGPVSNTLLALLQDY